LPYARAFGTVLRRLRKEQGLSQEALGLESGLTSNFISLIELGQKQPTITTVFKLAKTLNLKPSSVIAEVEAVVADFGEG
jgi:transcriptional regulator with XRE-family HTH domain